MFSKIKIKQNNKVTAKTLENSFNKIKDKISLLNSLELSLEQEAYYKNKDYNLRKFDTINNSIDEFFANIDDIESSTKKEKNHKNIAFMLRQLEILIDNLEKNIGSLEYLSNEKIYFQSLKKKISDKTLQFAYNNSETLEELIFLKLTQEYIQSVSDNIEHIRAVKERNNQVLQLEEKSQLLYIATNGEAFYNTLKKYTLSNGGDKLYRILCAQAFTLYSLLQKEDIKKICKSYRQMLCISIIRRLPIF